MLKPLTDKSATKFQSWINELRRNGKPRATLYYSSGRSDYQKMCAALVTAAPDWKACELFVEHLPWGSFYKDYMEGLGTHAGWPKFYDWLGSHDALGPLNERSGFLFQPGDQQALQKMIGFALSLGWDTWLSFRPGRHIIFLSHDDRMEIWKGTVRQELIDKLLICKGVHR